MSVFSGRLDFYNASSGKPNTLQQRDALPIVFVTQQAREGQQLYDVSASINRTLVAVLSVVGKRLTIQSTVNNSVSTQE